MNIIKPFSDLKNDLLLNKNVGTFSWFIHRITGLLLVFYICLHLCVLGSDVLFGKGSFNELMANFNKPLFKIMEIALIGAVGFHLLNGIRIIIADFFELTRTHRLLFWIASFLLLIVLIISAITLLKISL